MTVDELLQTPYWIIDILPAQVPKDSPGQYFAVEKYYLREQRLAEIKQKHINVVLKLNCYRDISIDGGAEFNSSSEHVQVNEEPDCSPERVGEEINLSPEHGTEKINPSPEHGTEKINPSPEHVAEEMRKRYLYIFTGESMILSEPDDTHMTVFNPDPELLELIRAIASSEGLFVWRPERSG